MSNQKTSRDEQVGFHKGALTTLAKERQELIRMAQIVEQLMQAHMKSLKDLGVDLEKEAQEALEKAKKENSKKLDERIA